jgi:hypothetical protein
VLGKLNEVTLSLAAEAICSYVVPLETVESYTQRKNLWSELEDKMRIRHDNASVPYAVAISGLGGVGKSQLALKFAETHKDHYNPILWVDATDKELVLSSFQRLATALQLQINANTKHGSVLTDDGNVQAVLRWLSKTDGKWLVIIDNADDFTFGIKNVIPKGPRGSVLITSQNELSVKLIPRGCEQIQVGDMSPQESTTLLLHHLRLSIDSPVTEIVTTGCKQVAEKLGYLALAIDLAGAYIGNEADPEDALTQYLDDFTRHGDALLQIDRFQELRPTQKTVWTVWDTTLNKINRDHPQLNPSLLLTFLAQFQGTIVEDEILRLAALGIPEVQFKIEEELPVLLQAFIPLNEGKWDSFQYRQNCKVLLRYSLLKQVAGRWPGVTMHGLVRWRALKSRDKEGIAQWKEWYIVVIIATCCQMTKSSDQPEFRRNLMAHLPQTCELARHNSFIQTALARVYYDEGRWKEAEDLFVLVMETRKRELGQEHPSTLTSMANLASTFWNQGRWKEAEDLEVLVMETSSRVFGQEHP